MSENVSLPWHPVFRYHPFFLSRHGDPLDPKQFLNSLINCSIYNSLYNSLVSSTVHFFKLTGNPIGPGSPFDPFSP